MSPFKLTLRTVLHRFKAVKGKNSAPISVFVASKFTESLKQKRARSISKIVGMLMQAAMLAEMPPRSAYAFDCCRTSVTLRIGGSTFEQAFCV